MQYSCNAARWRGRCITLRSPGVIFIGIQVKFVGRLKIERSFFELLQSWNLIFHHSQLKRQKEDYEQGRKKLLNVLLWEQNDVASCTWSLDHRRLKFLLLMQLRMKCIPWSSIRKFKSPNQKTSLRTNINKTGYDAWGDADRFKPVIIM